MISNKISPDLDPKKKVETNAPRAWPNHAKEARDRTAEEAAQIVMLLAPLVNGDAMSEADRVRREARAMIAAQTILRHMEAQGAQTRPE